MHTGNTLLTCMNLIQIAPNDRLDEFLAEPALTIASVLLIVVSIGWVVISRLIVRNLRKAAMRGRRSRRTESARPSKDIWAMPP